MAKHSQKKEKPSLFLYVKAYAPALAWATLIFLLSSQSTLQSFEMSTLDFLFKKSAHIFVYCVLYLLFLRATQSTAAHQSHQLWLPLTICLLYAFSDELHQSFVPGRYATVRDVGYDTLGISIGFLKSYNYI